MRETTEAIVGAVTGTLAAPPILLLGRFDGCCRLQYVTYSQILQRSPQSETITTVAGQRIILAPLPHNFPAQGNATPRHSIPKRSQHPQARTLPTQ
ncbi:hypothetical protein ACF1GY_33935 [Streptomyces sp. NPDC014684]|uniref:hypothetical protein n=1 Tax=Streptomyces sp. NPDC014684 TaxID=3364880 RepID=UPI0036F4EA5B